AACAAPDPQSRGRLRASGRAPALCSVRRRQRGEPWQTIFRWPLGEGRVLRNQVDLEGLAERALELRIRRRLRIHRLCRGRKQSQPPFQSRRCRVAFEVERKAVAEKTCDHAKAAGRAPYPRRLPRKIELQSVRINDERQLNSSRTLALFEQLRAVIL